MGRRETGGGPGRSASTITWSSRSITTPSCRSSASPVKATRSTGVILIIMAMRLDEFQRLEPPLSPAAARVSSATVGTPAAGEGAPVRGDRARRSGEVSEQAHRKVAWDTYQRANRLEADG